MIICSGVQALIPGAVRSEGTVLGNRGHLGFSIRSSSPIPAPADTISAHLLAHLLQFLLQHPSGE